MKKLLYLLLVVLSLPAICIAQPFQEIDPRSIWLNGVKTTTASIPFAQGLSVDGGSSVVFKMSSPSLESTAAQIYSTWSPGLVIDSGQRLSGGNVIGRSLFIYAGDTPTAGSSGAGIGFFPGTGGTGANAGASIFGDSNSNPFITAGLQTATQNGNVIVGNNLAVNGVIGASNGTLATPSYSFAGDFDTGIYHPGANRLIIGAGNQSRIDISTTIGLNAKVYINSTDGAASPSLAWGDDSTSGWWHVAFPHEIGFSINGVQKIYYTSTLTTFSTNLLLESASELRLGNANFKIYGSTSGSFLNIINDKVGGAIYITPDSGGIDMGSGTGVTTIRGSLITFVTPSLEFASPTSVITTSDNAFVVADDLGPTNVLVVDTDSSNGYTGVKIGLTPTADFDALNDAVGIGIAADNRWKLSIAPQTGARGLRLIQEPGGGENYIEGYDVSSILSWYITKGPDFYINGSVNAVGSLTGSVLNLTADANQITLDSDGTTTTLTDSSTSSRVITFPDATTTLAGLAVNQTFTQSQKINTNSTTAFIVEQDGVKDNVFLVDTTNAAVGINQAALTTSSLSILEASKNRILDTALTVTTRATGQSGHSLATTLSWTTGQGASTGFNNSLFSLTDSHITSSTLNDVIRNVNLSTSRSSTYNFPNAISVLVGLNQSSFSDSGTYSRASVLGQTVRASAFGTYLTTSESAASFAPTYNDGGAGGTLTYNGSFYQGGVSFSPVVTSGTIAGNLRGLYISSVTGSTIANVTSTTTGVDIASISNGTTAYGVKIATLSASTTASGIDISGVSTATTSYGIKINAVAGATTAYGLAIAAPTTATNKYAIAIDGLGGDSAINFNTPTRAGIERVYSGSTGQLTLEGGSSVAINKGYLYLTSLSADPTNGFQMYFYKPNYDLSASGKYGGFGEWHVTTPGANGFYGLQFTAQTDHTSGTQSGGMSAVNANVNIFHTGTGADSGSHNAGNYQITNYSALNSSGTWTAILGRIANNAAGNINVARSFSALNYLSGAGNVTTSINYYAQGFSDGGAGALTNNYGIYVEELTAGSTINREIFIAGAGGTYFRDGNQKIYSSAASTLDVTANTTYQERIGGTVELTLTATQLDLMSTNTDRVNFVGGSDGGAATTAGGAPTFTDYYGGNTKAMGDPTGWLNVKINGTARKIPYY